MMGMQKMKKSVVLLILAILISLLLTACGSTSLVGKWKDEPTGMVTMEFLDNGTLHIYVREKLEATAAYKLDGDTITITAEGTEKKGAFKLEGDRLTLTESDSDQTQVYVRQ